MPKHNYDEKIGYYMIKIEQAKSKAQQLKEQLQNNSKPIGIEGRISWIQKDILFYNKEIEKLKIKREKELKKQYI